MGANGDVVALIKRERLEMKPFIKFFNTYSTSPLWPGDRCDRIRVVGKLAQACHLWGAGTPKVDAGAQTYAKNIRTWPVDKVEVKVVL